MTEKDKKNTQPSFEPIKGAATLTNAKIASDEFDSFPEEIRQPMLKWGKKWFSPIGYRIMGRIIADRLEFEDKPPDQS